MDATSNFGPIDAAPTLTSATTLRPVVGGLRHSYMDSRQVLSSIQGGGGGGSLPLAGSGVDLYEDEVGLGADTVCVVMFRTMEGVTTTRTESRALAWPSPRRPSNDFDLATPGSRSESRKNSGVRDRTESGLTSIPWSLINEFARWGEFNSET